MNGDPISRPEAILLPKSILSQGLKNLIIIGYSYIDHDFEADDHAFFVTVI